MLHNLSHERVQEILHSQASLSDFVRSPMLAQPSALSAACTHGILGPQLSAKARVPTIPQEGTGPIEAADFGAASFFPNSVSLEGSNRGNKESHTIAPRGFGSCARGCVHTCAPGCASGVCPAPVHKNVSTFCVLSVSVLCLYLFLQCLCAKALSTLKSDIVSTAWCERKTLEHTLKPGACVDLC